MNSVTAPLITLLTDFGLQDFFVGVMKGVILSANPHARIVDLCHGIAPQDVRRAGFVLAGAYSYVPEGTIHVCVVDPGVGSSRRILAAEIGGHVFLAPDNGLLSFVLEDQPAGRIIAVKRRRFFRDPVSTTFHGRDIFAPVAGHLSLGRDIGELGEPAGEIVRFDVPAPSLLPDGKLAGEVVCVDRFGNLITNIRREELEGLCGSVRNCVVRIGRRRMRGVHRAYSSAKPGEMLALVNSLDRLEIAVRDGSAAEVTRRGAGESVFVKPSDQER